MLIWYLQHRFLFVVSHQHYLLDSLCDHGQESMQSRRTHRLLGQIHLHDGVGTNVVVPLDILDLEAGSLNQRCPLINCTLKSTVHHEHLNIITCCHPMSARVWQAETVK